jgi:hypothetical protein
VHCAHSPPILLGLIRRKHPQDFLVRGIERGADIGLQCAPGCIDRLLMALEYLGNGRFLR